MKFSKEKDNIIISAVNQRDLSAFLKSQISCEIIFRDLENNIDESLSIQLQSRVLNGNSQAIVIGDITNPSYTISYDTLLKLISTSMETGHILCIRINNKEFKSKEPLIAILGNINPRFISNCVSIDYVSGVFSIINKSFPTGESDKLYFFEENNSLLAFVKDGPVLIQNNPKIQSIEDVLSV